MGGQRDNADDRMEFAPIFIANLVPIAGIIWFNLAYTTLLLLYWFEILTGFVVYGGAALFAQQKTVTDGEDVDSVLAGNDDGLLSTLPTIRLPGSLPDIYLRNLGTVVLTMCIVGVMLFGVGDFILGDHEASDPFPAWLSAFTSPAVFSSAVAILGSHLVYMYRNYFRSRRYEDLCPVTVLEYPVRLFFVFIPGISLLFFAFILTGAFTLTVASQSMADRVALTTLIGGFFLLKTGIEWARFRAERVDEPSGLAGWLVPKEFRSEEGE